MAESFDVLSIQNKMYQILKIIQAINNQVIGCTKNTNIYSIYIYFGKLLNLLSQSFQMEYRAELCRLQLYLTL